MRIMSVLLLLTTLPAAAQEMTEIPEETTVPPSIEATLQAAGGTDQYLDRVRRWQGDLLGDSAPDQVVQAAFGFSSGGNAVILHQWVFESRGAEFVVIQDLSLQGGIKSATRDGSDLVLTLYKLLPDDPMCCPSGEEQQRIALK